MEHIVVTNRCLYKQQEEARFPDSSIDGKKGVWARHAARTEAQVFARLKMRIISIDPGGNTGMVFLEFDLKECKRRNYTAVDILTRCGWNDLDVPCHDVNHGLELIIDTIENWYPVDIVLMEDFHLWTVAADLTPVKVLAVVDWEIRQCGRRDPLYNVKLEYQSPGERNVITDERMKRWGLWNPGHKDINAAMKHMVVYLRKLLT